MHVTGRRKKARERFVCCVYDYKLPLSLVEFWYKVSKACE